ncbi:hypothetical protein [Methylobacterium sp. WSM2598]|uniref:hypothetical protein n=1 Tax=Methylobacterium sp. WSM2598 TaxID=398261 RepID=UPI00036E85E7|nr:hypothetical protein [Methylobacterium sp. WSM2598]
MDAPAERDARIAREKAGLVKAEQDIVAGERRVAEQDLRIRRLRAEGHDTAQAEQLLEMLGATLAEWQHHRRAILDVIHRLEAEGRASDR